MRMQMYVLFAILFTNYVAPRNINKCCAENEQLNSELDACVRILDPRVLNDTIRNLTKSLNKYPWGIHQQPAYLQQRIEIRENITLKYSTLSWTKLDITVYVAFEAGWKHEDKAFFDNYVLTRMIGERHRCVDTSVNPGRSPVVLVSGKLKALHKCCAKGERLDRDAVNCVPIPGERQQDIDEEVLIPRESKVVPKWIPKLAELANRVKYNYMKTNSVKWNTITNADSVTWIPKENGQENPVEITVYNSHNLENVTRGITEIFCFDEVAEGPLAPRALLAAKYDIRKCFAKGSQLSNDGSTPMDKPGLLHEKKVKFDVVDWRENPQDAFWVPKKLRNSSLGVMYKTRKAVDNIWRELVTVFDEDIWTLEKPSEDKELPRVTLNVTLLSGDSFTHTTDRFCFDFIEDVGRILSISGEILKDVVVKCCYPGEIISYNGYCIKHNGPDWTPGLSNALDREVPRKIPVANLVLPMKVQCGRFTTLPYTSPRVFQTFVGNLSEKGRWKTVFYCNDFQLTKEGSVKEVVGSCPDAPTADLYESIRPLGVASAILLVAAAIAAVAQDETRRSAHGRALACHAACLACAIALQEAWFFTSQQPFYDECYQYFYSVYFFMMAANFWLTAITVNMAMGFRLPLGAMFKAVLPKGQGAVWRRFGLLSAFAWGGSFVLTALAVAMYYFKKRIHELGLIAPSFFETRTCTLESKREYFLDDS